ncbi:uncharacterized protein LOC132787480 [Drosophila nasuta]|uniref:uncharacterized protein LOC132787480 n=1 Tax=Drosophila nasuta TaxID=42062 RepID=UPI00295E7BE4|nr:uncharacterized protein LOC132787480 [Drosophila nasuta]
MAMGSQYKSFIYHQRIPQAPLHKPAKMKVFALTLLSLLALSQARLDYKLQCTREEVGIRWPSYFSNSEYFVCQSIFGSQLTVHCPAGEVFSFVLQQCAAPALYVPAPPMDSLPTAAPITTHLIDEVPPVLGPQPVVHELPLTHHEEHEPVVNALPLDPTPPTPPTEPPTPPTVVAEAPKPGKRPVPPPPSAQKASAKKPSAPAPAKAAAKKPAAAAPAKAAKKPTPPSKGQKKA